MTELITAMQQDQMIKEAPTKTIDVAKKQVPDDATATIRRTLGHGSAAFDRPASFHPLGRLGQNP